jgi:iron complex outermembrane receptor protein
MQPAVNGSTPFFFDSARRFQGKKLILGLCLAASVGAYAQNQTSVQAPAGSAQTTQPAATSKAPQPATAQQKPAPVTTTVVVYGEVSGNYLPENVTVGTLGGEPLKTAPLSVKVVTRDLMNDQVSRLLSDVVKNDASVEDDYVPVGYYGSYMIRGFPIDLATGLEIDGMTIAGEQDVPLENKEQVEILHGLAGVESGVASAGGLIDYVTKRPTMIKALDLATDHRGTAYGAVDLGRLFGSWKQVGVRANLAGERIVTYMNDTNGWRAVGAAAADWKITPQTTLKGDFEYQHKTERDGSGYQLVGGVAPPNISQIFPSTMLGDQPWGPADTYDTFNTNVRVDHSFSPSWTGFAAASLSHSLIQDNVLYAYGCYYEAECSAESAPYSWFFAPDGTYDVYDYRDPGELRRDMEAEAMVTGHVRTGGIEQDLTAGVVLFLRSVQQPGFYTVDDPYSADGIVQDGAVYTYVGSDNIYAPLQSFSPATNGDGVPQQAGPRRLWEDSHQSSVVMQDRLHLPGRIQLIAGGRYDSLRDHNYSAYAGCADFFTGITPDPCAPIFSDKPVWLPQYAVTFNPVENLTLYGNYGVMLSLGPQAPFWAADSSQFLEPFFTRQFETGAKYEPNPNILLSADYFHMRAPFFYPNDPSLGTDCRGTLTSASAPLCFLSEGNETHDGVEVNAEGKAANWLRLTGSAAAIRAISNDTGTLAYDNKQVIDVPRLHTNVFADVTVPHVRGLHVMPGWSYTTRKEAARDDTVSVPGYNLFNLGMRYTPGGEQGRVTFRVYANNIADKRYWSDTGASAGDTFIWLGAPTTVRLSAHYVF